MIERDKQKPMPTRTTLEGMLTGQKPGLCRLVTRGQVSAKVALHSTDYLLESPEAPRLLLKLQLEANDKILEKLHFAERRRPIRPRPKPKPRKRHPFLLYVRILWGY